MGNLPSDRTRKTCAALLQTHGMTTKQANNIDKTKLVYGMGIQHE